MNFEQYLQSDAVFGHLTAAAKRAGVASYLVGGCVRDLLLGRNSKDIDVVCVGSGIALAECFAQELTQVNGKMPHITVFKNFGTAQVNAGDWSVEFVGARRESYQRDSRKPIVENGSLEDDQLRRDFTINALAISLNQSNLGTLLDPFDGQGDLRRKIIRTPLDPNITFSDDPLRMMRAIRFASQLGFDIHPDTFDAIRGNRHRLEIISQERITDELNKIILSKTPSYGFKLLFYSDLLSFFFPEMVALQGAEMKEGKGHKDNFFHTLQVLDNVAEMSQDLWLRWAAILHDIAKPATKRFHPKVGWTFHGHEDRGARMVPDLFRRFKLPLGEPMKFVQKLVKMHLRPIPLSREGITDSALRRLVVDAGNDLEALFLLCKADITSKDANKVQRFIKNFEFVQQKIDELEERDKLRNFQPIITGEIIMHTFNLPPSRTVGEIKSAVREAILDGIVPNEYPQAYNYMCKIAAKYGLVPKTA